MKMELKGFPKYIKYIEKIEGKTQKLEERIEKNEVVISDLKASYAVLFSQDEDTSGVAKKLAKIEDETNGLKRELEIITKSNFSPKQMAHELRDQYETLMKEVEAERSRLWQEAERIKIEARDKVEELNERRTDLATRFNLDVAHHQFRYVIDGLDISEESKHQMRLSLENGPIRGWNRIPELNI